MTTNFFEHETVSQNSSVSPVENLAIEVSDAFARLSTILSTTSILPSLSSVIGSYLLLDVNYHGFEDYYEESFSIDADTKDLPLVAEPTTITSVSYLDATTNTEVYLSQKLSQQNFTSKNQYKIIGKTLSLSGDFSSITLRVKYSGIRKSFGNLNLKPNIIKNSNNSYLVQLVKTAPLTYKLTYDVDLSTNFERIFGTQTIEEASVYLMLQDGEAFKNVAFTSVYTSGNDIVFALEEELDDNYSGVVYISNVSISEFLQAFYLEFISHNHSKDALEGSVKHSDLLDLYKNTSSIFYKDLGIVNYDHPQYLNREGYNASLSAVYENALLGDLFLASKITEQDQDYKTLLKNSNSILFGDPVRGSKIYYDSLKKSLNILSGHGLDGLNIQVGLTNKAISINSTSYLQEDADSLKIYGKNGIVEIVPLNSSETSVLKSKNVVVEEKLTANDVVVNKVELGNVVVSKDGNNIHTSLKDPAVLSKITSDVSTEFDDLKASVLSVDDLKLEVGDKISTSDKTYITSKDTGLNVVSDKQVEITSSGRHTGVAVGQELKQAFNLYTADYLGQQSSTIDTSIYMETPLKADTYLLHNTNEEVIYGTNKYLFNQVRDGYTNIESLKEWRRATLHAGLGTFYSVVLKASDGTKKNGLVIGTTKLSSIGQGLDCPAGMTLFESADTVAIIKPLAEDQVECGDVSYQNLDAGNIQAFGNLSVDDSILAVENITAGEALISKTLAVSESATLKTINVQSESVFSGKSEFNGAVDILNRVNITGSTDIGGSLSSVDISTENYASIGGTLTVAGQTILGNNVIVEGQISTSGGFTTTGPIQSDSLKTGPIEAQAIHSVGGLTVEGITQLTGPTKVDGSIVVNGNGLVQGSFEATSELTARSLYVTESTVIGGRLTVQGSTVLEGPTINIGATGSSITLTGTLQFDAPTTTLTGDVRIFKQLDVAQDCNVSGDITTSSTLTATNLKVSAAATIDGLLKADSGEFNRKTYFVEGIKANGDSDFTRLRSTEFTSTSATTNTMFVTSSLTMGPDSTVKTEKLVTSEFSQVSASSDVLISGPTRFLSTVKLLSKIIIGNDAIEAGRNTSGVLITDRELTMGNNSIIKATKIFATKGLPIGSNQDKNAGFCFESASNNGGTDGDTGFFATTGQGSGIDGSDLEFWIDGTRKGVISKNKVAYNASSDYDQNLVNIEMLKEALADMEGKLAQMNKATGDRFWPVNSIYTTMDERNPAVIMGFGTWIKFAPGRTLVGTTSVADPGGQISGGLKEPSAFNLSSSGQTYGEFEHQMTIAEMPKHSVETADLFHRDGAGTQDYGAWRNISAMDGLRGDNYLDSFGYRTSLPVGNDVPHNNVQPSITVNMWRRIN